MGVQNYPCGFQTALFCAARFSRRGARDDSFHYCNATRHATLYTAVSCLRELCWLVNKLSHDNIADTPDDRRLLGRVRGRGGDRGGSQVI